MQFTDKLTVEYRAYNCIIKQKLVFGICKIPNNLISERDIYLYLGLGLNAPVAAILIGVGMECSK